MHPGRAPARWNRVRRVVAAALAATFAVLLPAAITSAWIRGTILSTSGYVAAVTPVAASPAVRTAVRDAVTSQVDAALRHAEASLPPSTRVLAGLLGTRLAGFARPHQLGHHVRVKNYHQRTRLLAARHVAAAGQAQLRQAHRSGP